MTKNMLSSEHNPVPTYGICPAICSYNIGFTVKTVSQLVFLVKNELGVAALAWIVMAVIVAEDAIGIIDSEVPAAVSSDTQRKDDSEMWPHYIYEMLYLHKIKDVLNNI